MAYYTGDFFAHSIFSFKYFSLARKLEHIYSKQTTMQTDYLTMVLFGVQSMFIFGTIAFEIVAYWNPKNKLLQLDIANGISCLPAFVQTGFLILAFIKMRTLGLSTKDFAVSQR